MLCLTASWTVLSLIRRAVMWGRMWRGSFLLRCLKISTSSGSFASPSTPADQRVRSSLARSSLCSVWFDRHVQVLCSQLSVLSWLAHTTCWPGGWRVFPGTSVCYTIATSMIPLSFWLCWRERLKVDFTLGTSGGLAISFLATLTTM